MRINPKIHTPKLDIYRFRKHKLQLTRQNSANFLVGEISDDTFFSTGIKAQPLKNFWEIINPKYVKKLIRKGKSTNTNGTAGCFLKEKSDRPISTSKVHDCTVLYLHNRKHKTHALYHAYYVDETSLIKDVITRLMPEGVTDAAIIPGEKSWADRHKPMMRKMFHTLKSTNPSSTITIYENNSSLPEIVGYKGKVYQIPNKTYSDHLSKNSEPEKPTGQASFKVLEMDFRKLFYAWRIFISDNIEKDLAEFIPKNLSTQTLNILFKNIDELSINEDMNSQKIYNRIKNKNKVKV